MGPNTDIERSGEETDTFVFDQLQPGKYVLTETYTPEGYQGLKEPIEIVINEDGSVQIDGEEVADVLVAGEKQPDYTRCDQSGESSTAGNRWKWSIRDLSTRL